MMNFGNRRLIERKLKENVEMIELEFKLEELVVLVYLKCHVKD